ncbi:MAG: hypothetical protein J6S45_00775, partial [Firmicutes bacterium]|nr:hypothetical protein [Bacillota bacterium]
MKKILVLLLMLSLCFSFAACGGSEETPQPPADESTAVEPKSEKQIVMDAVNPLIQSQTFADWQTMYNGFTGEEPTTPKVTGVVRYQIPDFEGVKMDCYLIDITADVGYWNDPVLMKGTALENFVMFVDANTETVYDSISTNAFNINHNVAEEEGRATYLM